MNPMSMVARVVAVLLLLAAVGGSADATTPLSGTISCTSSNNKSGCQAATTLPPGKLWAIDNVSGFCSFDISRNGQNTIYQMYLTTTIAGKASLVFLSLASPGIFQPSQFATPLGSMQFSQLVRTFADAGSTVQLNANMVSPDAGTHLICIVYFQGHATK